MKKLLITIIFMMMSVVAFYPLEAKALSINDTISVSTTIHSLNPKTDIWNNEEETENCTGSNSILGDIEDEDSVAWLVQQILNYIKILGPILVVLLSSIDFISVIVKSDDEAMAKAQKKLILRLILAVLLFLIPTLVEAILQIFGITGNSTCGLQ